MSGFAYVNGEFVPIEAARVSVMDRGFLFADGIYEVTAVVDGALVDSEAHLARLARSLGEIAIAQPLPAAGLEAIERELILRNELTEGFVYVQITRGAGLLRDFVPPADPPPTLVIFTQPQALIDAPAARAGISVATTPDLRWARRDIKTVALLAQVLAKRQAAAAGCQEAWMVDGDGLITEGGSSTAFIVREGVVITRPNSRDILPGCTRRALQRLAEERQIRIEERPFTPAEAMAADEAFVTGATSFVLPVVRIDGRPVGSGEPGPLTRRLRELYLDFARGGQGA